MKQNLNGTLIPPLISKQCSTCGEHKALDQFGKMKTSKDGLRGQCNPCRNKKKYEWKSLNKDIVRNSILKGTYGISLDDYNAMLERQSGKCAICKTTDPGRRNKFCVDHNHRTGEVRGLLCEECNLGIGKLKDDPEILRKAATYLETT